MVLCWRSLVRTSLICLALLASGCGSESLTVSTIRDADFRDIEANLPPENGQSDHHDFGWVLPNSELVHNFVITNDSSHPWVIESVKSTCGCAVPRLARKTVPPHESVPVSVVFRSGVAPRRYTKQVRVQFASDVPDRVFTISAHVRPEMRVFPETFRADRKLFATATTAPAIHSTRTTTVSPPVNLRVLAGAKVTMKGIRRRFKIARIGVHRLSAPRAVRTTRIAT